MKKLLTIIAIAASTFISSCNDAKDPPDDGFMKMVAARNDSLAKVAELEKEIISKQ